MEKLEKKSVFSPHGRDETTTCRDRAKHFRKMGGQEKPRMKREREREEEAEEPCSGKPFQCGMYRHSSIKKMAAP